MKSKVAMSAVLASLTFALVGSLQAEDTKYFGTQFGNTGKFDYDGGKGSFAKISTASPIWRETTPSNATFEFTEVARTASVVVLYDAGRKITILLGDNGAFLSSPGTKGIFLQYKGSWDKNVTY